VDLELTFFAMISGALNLLATMARLTGTVADMFCREMVASAFTNAVLCLSFSHSWWQGSGINFRGVFDDSPICYTAHVETTGQEWNNLSALT
jgi:hypothetical protein